MRLRAGWRRYCVHLAPINQGVWIGVWESMNRSRIGHLANDLALPLHLWVQLWARHYAPANIIIRPMHHKPPFIVPNYFGFPPIPTPTWPLTWNSSFESYCRTQKIVQFFCWVWCVSVHTCKKREIPEIYLRNFFGIFRKILGWEREINTAPKPSPEVAPSKMEVAPS